jgi:thioredoxin 1
MIAPAFEVLAEEFTGKIAFGKLDTDAQSAIAQQYDIMTIPTFKVFQNGEEVQKLDRVRNKEHLKQFIEGCI